MEKELLLILSILCHMYKIQFVATALQLFWNYELDLERMHGPY